MSRNSKQRRAAKQRRDARRRAQPQPTPGTNTSQPGPGAAATTCDCLSCRLERQLSVRGDIAGAESLLPSLVAQAWRLGWQPSEVVRQIERSVSPVRPGRQLVTMAIAAEFEAQRQAAPSVDPRWSAQITAMVERVPHEPTQTGWVGRWADVVGAPLAERTCLAVAQTLASLASLLMLIPPPGVSPADVAKWSDLIGWQVDTTDTADPVLTKVRALLAKAEATDFPEEAEAFTAKAHALMAQHAVADADVRGRAKTPSSTNITARRFAIAEPYAKQHLLLLSQVAKAAGGRCVFHPTWALATVVASRRDLAHIEAMHASLMLQSQTAFGAASREADVGSHERSRGFRSSFLTAYAYRIGRRLREQHDIAERSASTDALPVLAADRDAIDQRHDALFGDTLGSMSFGASDAAGWDAGASAADRARLAADELYDQPVGRLSA